MRDGVTLSVDVYLPDTDTPAPAILHRTPYDNANPDLVATAGYFADHGYAFVAADVRGRGDSDGVFAPFRGEGPDGYDTIEWVAAQPWCDGKVGMMGGSYAGSTQWWAARLNPPHLVTMVSTATSGFQVQDPQRRGKLRPSLFQWLHRIAGHTMQPGLPPGAGPRIDWRAVLTHRPYRDIDRALGRTNTAWRDWLAHRTPDYWEQESAFHSFDRIAVPVLHITGWHDGSVVGELLSYERVRDEAALDDGQQFLLIGPWDHAGTRRPQQRLGCLDFGEQALYDIDGLHLRWFDHWLRGRDTGLLDEPRIRVFTMGVNRWQNLTQWPPPASPTRFYLRSGGGANTAAGDGRLCLRAPGNEPADRYIYDPADATPSTPEDEVAFWGEGPLERIEHGFVEDRADVLVYTTDPLTEDVEVTGKPYVRLWAETDAVDTDFAAVLTDVHQDGRSITVAEGLVRAAYRDPLRAPALLTPGQVQEYHIPLNPTSIVFRAGHRIRLCVVSAEFPAYDRNPNTGAFVGDDDEIRVATQRVHHRTDRPSYLCLPVVGQSVSQQQNGE
jgi:putative CocE/NonD family hydrolase